MKLYNPSNIKTGELYIFYDIIVMCVNAKLQYFLLSTGKIVCISPLNSLKEITC